jgi:hypothetical protein
VEATTDPASKALVGTYLKVGRAASLCVIASAVLGGCLIAAMTYRPGALSADTIETLQVAIGLFFFLAWAATIGSYAVVSHRSRLLTWLLFCGTPFSLYAMLVLIARGSSPGLPTLGAATTGRYFFRAIVGSDH